MEVQEEALGSKEYTQIMKGKRTKRPRQASPLALAMASSSSSMAEDGSSGGVSDNSGGGLDRPATSLANTGEFTDSTGEEEEEEDMANCLILLAQGQNQNQNQKSSEPVVAPTTSKTGLYLYQCKTCNRCFSSFQALGGHRASHKKPKAAIGEEKKPLMVFMKESDQDRFDHESTALSLQIPNRVLPSTQNNKSRVHECSVCGAEFSSGQALGGHMRRHRTMSMAATTSSESQQQVKKPRNLLSLDLNLPAPEDDRRESKFPFASKEQVIVFSASSLVDCHY